MSHPTQVQLTDPQHLEIAWSDGQTRRYTVRELRDRCPCASCREQRGQPVNDNPLQILDVKEAQPVSILGMKPVGNYAYGIEFSDGHNTGIFTLEFLQSLGELVDAGQA
jgi:DUF971 family protein